MSDNNETKDAQDTTIVAPDSSNNVLDVLEAPDKEGDDSGKTADDVNTETKVPDSNEAKDEGDDTNKVVDDKKDDEGDKTEVIDPRDAEIKELRGIVRAQRRQNEELSVKVDNITKALKEAKVVDEETEFGTKVDPERAARLENILEVMRINPKFEDVDDVVCQDNFDFMVDAIAHTYVDQHGGKIDEVRRGVTAEIWAMPNPYKYMYGLIKENHPAYVKSADTNADTNANAGKDKETVDKDKEIKKEDKAELTGKEILGSVFNAGGGHTGEGKLGWTSKMIDNLPEDELHKVPSDIYSLYMQNKLD